MGIIEGFGKFSRIAYPGCNLLNPFCGESIAGMLSLRVQQLVRGAGAPHATRCMQGGVRQVRFRSVLPAAGRGSRPSSDCGDTSHRMACLLTRGARVVRHAPQDVRCETKTRDNGASSFWQRQQFAPCCTARAPEHTGSAHAPGRTRARRTCMPCPSPPLLQCL